MALKSWIDDAAEGFVLGISNGTLNFPLLLTRHKPLKPCLLRNMKRAALRMAFYHRVPYG